MSENTDFDLATFSNNVAPATPLYWYEYDQNNSGGRYVRDANVSERVYVQATNAREADARMNSILEDTDTSYCACCGERWYIDAHESERQAEPMLWVWFFSHDRDGPANVRVEGHIPVRNAFDTADAATVRFHAYDGRVVAYDLPKAPPTTRRSA